MVSAGKPEHRISLGRTVMQEFRFVLRLPVRGSGSGAYATGTAASGSRMCLLQLLTCKPSNSGFTDCFGPSVLEEKSFGTSDRLSGTKPPGCMALVSGDTPPSGWSGEEGGDLDNRTFLMLPDLRASSAQELEDILYCTDFLVM